MAWGCIIVQNIVWVIWVMSYLIFCVLCTHIFIYIIYTLSLVYIFEKTSPQHNPCKLLESTETIPHFQFFKQNLEPFSLSLFGPTEFLQPKDLATILAKATVVGSAWYEINGTFAYVLGILRELNSTSGASNKKTHLTFRVGGGVLGWDLWSFSRVKTAWSLPQLESRLRKHERFGGVYKGSNESPCDPMRTI